MVIWKMSKLVIMNYRYNHLYYPSLSIIIRHHSSLRKIIHRYQYLLPIRHSSFIYSVYLYDSSTIHSLLSSAFISIHHPSVIRFGIDQLRATPEQAVLAVSMRVKPQWI